MYNRLSVKRYTPTHYKVCLWKHSTHTPYFGKKPVEVEDYEPTPEGGAFPTPEADAGNKPRTSYSRARSMVYELAACNPWQCMVTITIDPAKYDPEDLPGIMKDFAMWFRNQRRIPGFEGIKYLLVPEHHTDKNTWHLHGFFLGLPEKTLVPFDFDPACLSFDLNAPHSDEEWSWYKWNKKRWHMNEDGYLNWPALEKKYGFFSAKMHDGKYMFTAAYITKYITKDFYKNPVAKNACLYYPCQGLNRAERSFYGTVVADNLFSEDLEAVRKRIFAFSNFKVSVGISQDFKVKLCEEYAVIYLKDGLNNSFPVYVSGYTDFFFDQGSIIESGGSS